MKPKKSIEDALYDYVSDCLAWNEDPTPYIAMLRLVQQSRNFEDILKTTITFVKRHGDKLPGITDDGIKAVFEKRAEASRELDRLLSKRAAPRAAAKKLPTPKVATVKEGENDAE